MESRKGSVINRISTYNPDIIGIQESIYLRPDSRGYSKQRAYLVNAMAQKGYRAYVGTAADNSDPIFYKSIKSTFLGGGDIKLVAANPTSKDGPAARYLTWVRPQLGAKNTCTKRSLQSI